MANRQQNECYLCKGDHGDITKWIGCSSCENWAHIKCANLGGIKVENIKLITWVCRNCVTELSAVRDMMTRFEFYTKKVVLQMKEMTENVEKLMTKFEEKIDTVNVKLEDVATMKQAEQASSETGMWVDVVKRKSKQAKKNLLVVRTEDGEEKVIERKKDVSRALEGVQVTDARFTKAGNIVMNFENEHIRDEAAKKLENVNNVTTKVVKKLKPKIMICNVQKEENQDMIVKTLIERNDYLQSVSGIENMIEKIFIKQAAGDTLHYILRCDPRVRELIHKNNDKVKLEWGVYKVRDRYHTLMCYHCQRYGHIQANCIHKDDDPYCFKCAGSHKSRDCTSSVKKCINCMRYKKCDLNHSANGYGCSVLQSEIEKIRNITDHGY